MPDTPAPKHVFMSYSRRDEAVMQRVVGFLRGQGFNVWVDNEKLVPGTPIWEVEVEKAIISAGAVVVLLSPDSNNSPWVRREISFAEDNGVRIFPILIIGDEKNAVPIRLTNHQRIDVRQNEEIGLSSLHTAISFYLEGMETQHQGEKETIEKAPLDKGKRKEIERLEYDGIVRKENIVSKKTRWISIIWITLGMAIGMTIGLTIGEIMYDAYGEPSRTVISGVIGGTISTIFTILVLRLINILSNNIIAILIILGWIISLTVAGLISLLSDNYDFQAVGLIVSVVLGEFNTVFIIGFTKWIQIFE